MRRSVVQPILSLAVVPLLVLPACDSRAPQHPPSAPRKLTVVTTLTVLGDLIEQVGGDKVEVRALVPPGGEPHTYQPAPNDMKTVAQARLIFYNGAHLEAWIDDTIRHAGKPDVPIVVLSQGLPMIRAAGGEPNPHLWLDVTNAKAYVERIRDHLTKVDAANAGYYADRAKAYLAQLDELDNWIHTEVAKIPASRRKLVTFHDAFPYFAGRYGFTLQGVVVASPGKEPSARQLTALARQIKQAEVPAVFAESQFNPKVMEVLATEARIKVVTNLYNDSLSIGPEADSYMSLMKHNVTQIVKALK